jgi:ribosomal protein L37AE/L43A
VVFLIIKERGVTLKHRKLEALLRRLPTNHGKRMLIEDDYRKYMMGIKGEESLDYFLQFLDQKMFNIFQDLRIEGEYGAFQIDFLLLTYKFMLIIESKYYAGEITIEENYNQLIKKYKDKIEYYSDPIKQVLHQKFQLKKWLEANKFHVPPIETLVTFTNPNSIIKTIATSPIYKNNIIRPNSLIEKIEQIGQCYTKDVLSQNIKRLNKSLLKAHSPLNENVLEKYSIEKKEILDGVQCPKCQNMSMQRRQGIWECTLCNAKSKEAHIKAIEDYSLLISNKFTNKDIKGFLHLDSIFITSRLLKKLNISYEGEKKARIYHLHT